MDVTEAIAPRSDQMNAEDLLTGPRTFTVASVHEGNHEQPVNIVLREFPEGRPFRPSKSMLRVLSNAWGKQTDNWVGKRLTLYRDPEVTFGRDKVGGIRISHLSHIDKPLELWLTKTRGKRAPFTVQPLADDAPAAAPVSEATVARLAELRAEWTSADAERRKVIEAEVAKLGGDS